MRHTRLWLSALLAILLAGCQMVAAPPPTPEAEEAPAGGTIPQPAGELRYTDPQGRFTVPIPTNWSAKPVEDYVVLASPEDQILVYWVVVPGEDVQTAIAHAWSQVDPDFALEPDETLTLPPSSGFEAIANITYDTGDDQVVVAAGGMLRQGVVYVMLLRADLVALQQRAAQLGIIQSGFKVTGLEQADLSGATPLPLDAALLAEFEAYVAGALTRFGIPGAAVAVVQDGEIVYANGFGVRELGGAEPVTPDTRMMIGSTGKSMTTMMMATLVDDGLMQWDTPVRAVLPQFAVADPQLSDQITMRNLVCACTGVPRRDLELFFNNDTLSAEGIVESLQTFQFFTGFGEAFQYSNQLVATAGYAAAAAAGGEWGHLYERYVSEMQQRVLDPIGMAATTFDMDAAQAEGNFATPHSFTIEGSYAPTPLDAERFVTAVAPAGAPWSTAQDMARYLITELNRGVAPDGTRVVSAENLAVTWQPQVPVSAEASYGLGWIVDSYKGQPMIQHGGNTLGFTSDLAFLPEAGVGITVLTNAQITNAFSEAVRYRLLELIFQQPAEADTQAEFTAQMIRDQFSKGFADTGAADPAQVAPFLGRYSNDALGEIELRMEGDQLVMDAGEFVTELRAHHDDAGEVDGYVTTNLPLMGLPVKLQAGTEGRPQVVLGTGAVEYTFTPLE